MLIIDINTPNKETVTIKVPQRPQEISLMKFIEFDIEATKLFSEVKKGMSNREIGRIILTEKYQANRIKGILMLVSKFLDIEPDVLLPLSIGKLDRKTLISQEVNLLKIFANIVLAAYNYTPPVIYEHNNTFEYQGTKWSVPYFKDTFIAYLAKVSLLNPLLRTGDMAEIEDSLKILQEQTKEEHKANYEMMQYLTIISVLATKENEIEPNTIVGIKRRKEERMAYFEAIDMVTGLNVDFFLGCTIETSLKTLPINTTLIPQA